MKSKIWSACAAMFKIGCIGFGGGNALIPIIQKIAVDEKQFLSQEDYEEDIVVASITPGALPVELAGGLGKRIYGRRGMLLVAGSMALPGVIATVLLTSILNGVSNSFYEYIGFATVGVMAYISHLLTKYISGTAKQFPKPEGRKSGRGIFLWLIILGVFVLTCGKNFYRILSVNQTPLLGLSPIHIFAMAFFIIFFTRGKVHWKNGLISGILCLLFILGMGKSNLIESQPIMYGVETLMMVLALFGFVTAMEETRDTASFSLRELILDLLTCLLGIAGAGIIALLVGIDGIYFIGRGFLSSIMSFGGGDAYLTVADGMFVQTGLISDSDFYSQLVPIVNILPGSILCKTLSGVGYLIGFGLTQNTLIGYIVGAAGFLCSLVASCGVFAVIGDFYMAFRDFGIFRVIKVWIRPIVSGLMLTVILSLIYQCVKIGTKIGIGYSLMGVMVFTYATIAWMDRKGFGMGSRILASVVISCIWGLSLTLFLH